MTTTPLRSGAGVLLTLVAVFVAGATSVHFAPEGSDVAAWWPAAGFAVALVALCPRRWLAASLVGVLVACTLANAVAGREAGLALALGVANAAEAALAGLVLRRTAAGRGRLLGLEDFFRLVTACVLGALVAATIAGLSVSWLLDSAFLPTWRSALAAHAAATLVLVPAALTWRQPWPPRERLGEALAQSLALAVAVGLVFAPEQHLSLAYAPLPLLVWAGLRLGPRTTSVQLAALGVAATWATARGAGPFTEHVGHEDISPAFSGALVQSFVLSAAVMALPLAVTVAQRTRLLGRLTASEQLFRRNFTESVVGMLLLRHRDGGLDVSDANDAAARVLGRRSAEDLLGRALAPLLEDGGALERAAADLVAGRRDSWSTEVALAADHERRVRLVLTLIGHDEDGALCAAQLLDVTTEHHASARLAEEREMLRAMLEATSALIVVTDRAGTVVRVNPATTRLTGHPAGALLGRPVWEHLAVGADAERLRRLVSSPRARLLGETDVATAEPGRTLRVAWTTDLVRDASGEPTHLVLTGADLTAERAAADLMSRVMDSDLGTALVGLDGAGTVTQVNRGAARLLGVAAADLVGRTFTDLLDPAELAAWAHDRDLPATFEGLARWAASAPAGASREWSWVGPQGAVATVSTTLSVVRDASGSLVGFFCVGRDVTAARRSHELLVAALEKERNASDRLRELDAAKDDFVSTVSHELRTPVTSIVGYTEMLADGVAGDLDAVQASMLAAIERNGQRLLALADDLLTLSRLESRSRVPELVPLDLRETLRSVEVAVRPMLAGRWLDVAFELPETPVVVLGDAAQLDRAVLNLLSNAVKFTEDGGEVRCRLVAADGRASLVVADTGIGVPEAEQPALFSKFYRSSTAQERAIQGTGLGLSIVASIVELHGGSIGVVSAVDEGTEVTVELPLAPASASRPIGLPAARAGGRPAGEPASGPAGPAAVTPG